MRLPWLLGLVIGVVFFVWWLLRSRAERVATLAAAATKGRKAARDRSRAIDSSIRGRR